MDKLSIIKFMNEHPDFSLATTDGNIPHVRTLMLHKANESGIYFTVGKFKEVYRQLSLNPRVELCFHSDKFQVRIKGVVENLDRDKVLKEEILEARPFMKPWIDKVGLKYMAVFCLRSGEAVTWSLETEMEPQQPVQL